MGEFWSNAVHMTQMEFFLEYWCWYIGIIGGLILGTYLTRNM